MKAEQLDGLRTIVSNKSRLPSLTLRPGFWVQSPLSAIGGQNVVTRFAPSSPKR